MVQTEINKRMVITDGSRLIIESLARAGADAFIGYPITPANLLYSYSAARMPVMLPAPDEITTLQWMSGMSAAGKLPVTATSFPGYALMLESINMAFMMELPMVIILVQRLGPATGTATCGAQGDLLLLRGQISGGHQMPVLCVSDYNDCWNLAAEAVALSVRLRTPVVLLTSKESVMTQRSFNISELADIKRIDRPEYNSSEPYRPYRAESDLVPQFLHVANSSHQVRINASTHDEKGILQHTSPESIANTLRLEDKAKANLSSFTFYDYDSEAGADKLVVAFDITAAAARDAVKLMRKDGQKVSLLIPKTLLPVPDIYFEIIEKYGRTVIAEENVNAQYASILFGQRPGKKIVSVGSIGKMITPEEIIKSTLEQ
jgi:2-oxoglutarate/2-oxoacid ferredoxin oxidoreductase subunit alpha